MRFVRLALTLFFLSACGQVRTIPVTDHSVTAERAERLAEKLANTKETSCIASDVASELRSSAAAIREQGANIKELQSALNDCETKAKTYENDHNTVMKVKGALFIAGVLLILGFLFFVILKLYTGRIL